MGRLRSVFYTFAMAREAIWTGSLSFGLVNIPVTLRPAESRKEIGFSMLDRRDMSPIGFRKINKNTGEEVPKQEIVKGFKIDEDRYVLVGEEDFKRVAPERSQRVDIQAFVDVGQIDPAFFEKPYYLEPTKKSEKPYALLREAMKRTGKGGIATVVIRAKQYLAAVIARGPAIMIELLRFAHELRDPSDLHLPEEGKRINISEAEMKMAERLIGDLAGPWEPQKFKDTYHDELLAFIHKKAEEGNLREISAPEKPGRVEPPVDIMDLLKQSVAHVERTRRAEAGGLSARPRSGAHRSRYLH